jgi:hypothetical protein
VIYPGRLKKLKAEVSNFAENITKGAQVAFIEKSIFFLRR